MSPERLNSYYPVVQWSTVRLMLIFQFILGFRSHIIDFANTFAQADITIGEPVFVEITSYFKSDGGQFGVVIRLKKILCGQAKDIHVWYENL